MAGADAALECVGTEAAVDQALGVLHNGGRMGFVGVPHYNNRALGSTFMQKYLWQVGQLLRQHTISNFTKSRPLMVISIQVRVFTQAINWKISTRLIKIWMNVRPLSL